METLKKKAKINEVYVPLSSVFGAIVCKKTAGFTGISVF